MIRSWSEEAKGGVDLCLEMGRKKFGGVWESAVEEGVILSEGAREWTEET